MEEKNVTFETESVENVNETTSSEETVNNEAPVEPVAEEATETPEGEVVEGGQE